MMNIYIICIPLVQAQEVVPQPLIISDESVPVNRNIIFRADLGDFPQQYYKREFLWEFGDSTFSSREEVPHVYQKPGRFVARLKLTFQKRKNSRTEVSLASKEIFVYERAVFFLSDKEQEGKTEALKVLAEDKQVLVNDFSLQEGVSESENNLKRFEKHIPLVEQSDTLVVLSDRLETLGFLSGLSGRVSFEKKKIIVMTEKNMVFLKSVLQGVFRTLSPQEILVTRKEAIDEVITTPEKLRELITARGYDLLVIDQATPSSLFSLGGTLISSLKARGAQDKALLIVLSLPLIVFLITFFRLIIGLSPFGMRLPVILTYCFFLLGLSLTIISFLLFTGLTYLLRASFFKTHLLYPAKVGFLTALLGTTLFILISVVTLFQWGTMDLVSILLLVVLAVLMDRIGGETEKKLITIAKYLGETFLIALLGYLLISSEWTQLLLLSHPEIVLLILPGHIAMGKFTGLRITEYFRFREILKLSEEE